MNILKQTDFHQQTQINSLLLKNTKEKKFHNTSKVKIEETRQVFGEYVRIVLIPYVNWCIVEDKYRDHSLLLFPSLNNRRLQPMIPLNFDHGMLNKPMDDLLSKQQLTE